MNTIAAFAFALVMILGFGALTLLVYLDRRRTTPPPLDTPAPPRPPTIWHETIQELGDPHLIDFDSPWLVTPWYTGDLA